MRQNYKGNKKRIEEAKRKKKEEKRNKRLGKKEEAPLFADEMPIVSPDI